jgi:hypothetical protein
LYPQREPRCAALSRCRTSGKMRSSSLSR